MVDIKKYGIEPFGAVPNERQLNHYYMGKKAFFHFGVNTFTGLEWGDGTEAEKLFDPTELDIRQWIRSIKAAGFKLAIITAKHHDGFCLWPSKYNEHSVKNSPYKNGKGDIIREFTDACHEYGVKVGIYLSPWDRNSEFWGTDEYSEFYARQLTELVTEYGKIDEIWWDGAGSTETVYNWGHWAYIIRENQPDAAIFGALGAADYVDFRWVGNELGFAGETHYASIDKKYIKVETSRELNKGAAGEASYIPSETDVSIRPGWFYHKEQDDTVKTVHHLNKIWFESIGRNSMLLLNFPPDRRGLICDIDVNNAILSHRCISKMLSVNYAAGAQVTASPALMPELSIDKVTLDDNDLFYASAENNCVVDVVLPEKTLINVFTLGELVEAGERITAFKIEDMSDGNAELLYSGTSVGVYKAVMIKEKEYTHLRLTITETLAPPVLRTLGLHIFEDIEDENMLKSKNCDLATLSTTKMEYSEDGKSVEINFGGIYPLNEVSFKLVGSAAFQIDAFDGVRYRTRYRGRTEDGSVCAHIEPAVFESYQIRIKADTEIHKDVPMSIKFV